jgi:hypothetical protein
LKKLKRFEFEFGFEKKRKRKEKKRKTINPTQLPPRPTTTFGPSGPLCTRLPPSPPLTR